MSLKNIKLVAIAAAAAVGLSLAASAGVAKFGEVEYDTLDAALSAAAASGGTVEVIQDCPLSSPFTNNSAAVTVNLGGKTVTYAGAGFAFTVTGEGNSLTITNGTFKGTGEGGFLTCTSVAQFVLDSVTADQECDTRAIVQTEDCYSGRIAKCVIGGVETRTRYAVYASGTGASKDYEGVTIEDSTIRTTGTVVVPETLNWNSYYKNAALLVGGAKVRIVGETTEICGSVHAIYTATYGGIVNIEGGKFTTLQDFFSVLAFDHPSHGGGWRTLAVTIAGGEFTGRVYVHGHANSSLSIAGGDFKNFEGWQGGSTSPTTMSITGGTFDGDPNIFKGRGSKGSGLETPNPALDLVATAANKIGVEGEDDLWSIVDAAQVSAVPGANSTLTKLEVNGETIYDTENPVVGTLFPYSVSGMVVEGFDPVKMKVRYDTDVAATYVADAGYHFGEWKGDESETMQTKTGTASEEDLNLDGDDAALPPSADDAHWIGGDAAKWSVRANWQENLVPSTTATVTFASSAVVDLDVDASVNNLVLGNDAESLTFMTTSDTLRTLTVDGQRYETYYNYGASGKTIAYVGSNVAANVSTTNPNGISGHGIYKAADGAAVTMAGVRSSDNTMAFVSDGEGAKLTLTKFDSDNATIETDVTFEAANGAELKQQNSVSSTWPDGLITYRATDGYIFSDHAYNGAKPVISIDNGTLQFKGVSAHAADGTIDLSNGGEIKLNGDFKIGLNYSITLTSDGTGRVRIDSSSSSASISLGAKAVVNLKANPAAEYPLFKTVSKSIVVNKDATFNIDTSALDNAAGNRWVIPLFDQGTATSWTSFKTPVLNAVGGTAAYILSLEQEGTGKKNLVIEREVPAGPTVDGDATITPAGDGQWVVAPNGETAITVSGLKAGDKVTVPVDAVETVTGVPSEDLILKVNDVEVDNQYFVGDAEGSGTFITELGEKAAPVIGEEGVETPFVVGETAEVTIKAIPGLYYQLIRGGEVTKVVDPVDEKTLDGVFQTITLTDDQKPEGAAFYKVGVTKGAQITNK